MPEEGRGEGRQPRWSDLYAPVRVLVFLLIVVSLLQIYQAAQFVVNTILSVVLLFVFAAIIAMLLTPLVDRIENLGPLQGRRGLAVVVLNLLVILALAGILAILIPNIATQGAAFVTTFPNVANDLQSLLNDVLNQLNARGIPVQAQIPQNLAGTALAPVLGSAVQVITGTLGAAVNLILVTVIAIYLQVEGRGILASMRQLFPAQEELFDFTVVAAGTTLAGYVRGQVIFAAIMAGYTGITLQLIGVKFALVIAVITFFLELIPLIGAPVAMLLAIAVALLQSPLVILLTVIATVGGHVVGAYTIGLKIYGQSARIHPLVAMGALVLGAQLGGILGALFAIPVAGILNVYLGALYRVRSGGDAFELPSRMVNGEQVLEELPNLGDEISQKAEEEDEREGVISPHQRNTKGQRPRRTGGGPGLG
jgi:predicted PurR-regulated permease PerM